jgi:hypothetical protein
MANDRTKVGGQDRKRINLNQDYELRDWLKSLDCTEQQLGDAVKAVGEPEHAVRKCLDGGGRLPK